MFMKSLVLAASLLPLAAANTARADIQVSVVLPAPQRIEVPPPPPPPVVVQQVPPPVYQQPPPVYQQPAPAYDPAYDPYGGGAPTQAYQPAGYQPVVVQPAAPVVEAAVWIPGVWDVRANRRVWCPGHWVRRPEPRHRSWGWGRWHRGWHR